MSAAHNWVTLEATGETTRRRQLTAGIRGGYGFAFRDDGKGFATTNDVAETSWQPAL